MPPTKATDNAIAKGLADVVRQIYNSPKRDDLTVNHARQVAETKLKLDDGFLKGGDWKAKSKQIIVDTLNELEAADAEAPEPAAPTPKKKAKPAPKRAAPREKKRPKKAPTPSDAESEISDVSDVEDAPAPPAKKRKLAKGPKGRSKVFSDDDDNNSAASEGEGDQEPPKPTEQPHPKQPTDSESVLSDVPDESPALEPASENEENVHNDSSSDLSDVITVELPKRKQPSKPKPKPKATKPAATAEDDLSSSELSSILDDAPPPPKRKPSKSKPTTATSTPDSPDEAQIKLLQSHLAKCGVRKVWAFEFKKHGADTPKSRIAYLRGLLADVGMPGRFSEARAREIKEMRELQADLQDVMQGEKSWGIGGGGRGVRTRAGAAQTAGKGKGKGKGKEVAVSVEEEEGSGDGGEGSKESEESEEEEEGGKLAVRGKGPAKRRADLAFLEDESESE